MPGLDDVQREVRRRLAEDRADQQRQQSAQPDEEQRRGERAAATEPHPGRDEAHPGGEREQERLPHEPELRHREVELGLEGRKADQQRADEAHVRT